MSAEPVFGGRQAQPLDDILRQTEAIDLEKLEKILGGGREQDFDVRVDEIAEVAFAIAGSHDGRPLLEWLCDITVRRPFFIQGMGIEQAALYAAQREGQNAVIHALLKAVKKGQDQYEARNRS